DHLLDLLDDLRESLPAEVHKAGAIVEQRTAILQQAQAEAERLTGVTRSESDQILAQAERQRDEIIARAEAEAERLVAEGRRQRDLRIADGETTHAELIAAAQAEHERLVTDT